MNWPILLIRLGLLWLLVCLLSADFFDPTLFNQAHPAGEIQNWGGVVGALIAGSLLELFGLPILLICWFGWFWFHQERSFKARLRSVYYTSLLMTASSLLMALSLNPSQISEQPPSLLWQSGYLGVVVANWMQGWMNPVALYGLCGLILVGCLIKLKADLPFKPMMLLAMTLISAPGFIYVKAKKNYQTFKPHWLLAWARVKNHWGRFSSTSEYLKALAINGLRRLMRAFSQLKEKAQTWINRDEVSPEETSFKRTGTD